MKTIYLDADYKCHIQNDGTMQEIKTDVFDGKCDRYIKGYRFIPAGARWIRADGTVFSGEMAAPFVDHRILAACQEQYEDNMAQIADMQTALDILEVRE